MAIYKGRKVTLNKPTRICNGQTCFGKKKFKVFVKNKNDNVVRVTFGDPKMRIRKNEPGRRKSFRARHKCDTAKDKTSARYWSCKKW